MLLPDVSEFQSPANGNAPNWAGIKAQNGGAAIIRVGYGNAHLDNQFVSNYTKLKQNNFSFIGLYHYMRAGQDATSQANAFCNWVGPLSALFPGSIPILDLEEGSGDQSGRANTWFNIVDHAYGLDKLSLNQRSWLYSGDNFARSQGLTPIFNSARHTWVAAYGSSESGLLPHTLWQSTDGQSQFPTNRFNWSGCGFVDTSIYHGDLPTLASMAYRLQDPVQNPQPPAQSQVIEEEQSMLKATEKTTVVSFGNGAYSWISFFSDPSVEGKPTQHIRVAPWSADNGGAFAGIVQDVAIDQTDEKVTVQLPAHTAGISIQRTGTQATSPDDWAPIAWNLGPTS
jgi:hypothetical protein